MNISKRLAAPCALLLTLSIAAACTGGGEKGGGLLDNAVHAGLFTTGSTNNRVLVAGNDGFVVSSGDNKVERIDMTTCTDAVASCTKTGEVVLPVGSNPYDVILGGGSLWVSNLLTDTIARVNPATLAITSIIDTSGALALSTPQSFAYSNGKLFVSNGDGFGFGPGFVAVVTGTNITATVATTQPFPIGITPLTDGTIAVLNGGTCDFATDPCTVTAPGGIDIINPATNAFVRNLPLGDTLPGPAIELSSTGTHGFAPSKDATLLKVDLATGTVQTLQLSTATTFLTFVVRDGTKVYALSFNEDRIYVIDEASFTVDGYIEVGPGGATPAGPTHAAVWDSGVGGKRLLVLLSLANSMSSVEIP